ncbi:SIR2 family protein [Microbulbifer echini]|uniref:SIR2 family protein n=1 Tax=Microbulbifer echini TaxID=1529067 RepID=A0ABV4NSA3_9GAMM
MAGMEIDLISKQAQDYYGSTPVIILGSGASAAHGMSGMGALSQHLIRSVEVEGLSCQEVGLWGEFCGFLEDGVDLETALHKVNLTPALTSKVVLSTWNLLSPEDVAVFEKALVDQELFPLGKLLRHMLRSTVRQVNIITPNYDRLAEYACEQESIHHFCGFSHGYKGFPEKKDYLKPSRQVNIWKVHGSLGWFVNDQGVVCSLGNIGRTPEGLTPLIVTPGNEKYRSTHREPYKTIIHEADDVIDAASSYLCIGFGFNDDHIQEKLVNRCAKGDASITVVTQKLSESARNFLFRSQLSRYLAIEMCEDGPGSLVYSSECVEPIKIERNCWSLGGFLNLIM